MTTRWRTRRRLVRASAIAIATMVAASLVYGAEDNAAGHGATPDRSAGWELRVFLTAERELEAGNPEDAWRLYVSLVQSVLENPTQEEVTRWDSGVIGVALWRLFILPDQYGLDAGQYELDETVVFDVADRLLADGSPLRDLLSGGMSFVGTSLAEFEADLWSCLATLAWEVQDVPRAAVYFGAAQSTLTSWDMPFGEDLTTRIGELGENGREHIVALLDLYGFAPETLVMRSTAPAHALWRGKHLMGLRLFWDSIPPLTEAMRSTDPKIRVEAGLALADALYRVQEPNAEIVELLGGLLADETIRPEDRQLVLLSRSRMKDRSGDLEGAIADLKDAIAGVMRSGPRSSEVLYRLALRHGEKGANLQREYKQGKSQRSAFEEVYEHALEYFALVRGHLDGDNEYANLGHYRAAHLEYSQGNVTDALELLKGLRDRTSNDRWNRFYGAARFWLGRLYRETGDAGDADVGDTILAGLADEIPFDYYGIRARMHVNAGPSARRAVLADDMTASFVRDAYLSENVFDTNVAVGQDDHRYARLAWSLAHGVYAESYGRAGVLFRSGFAWYNARDPMYLSSSRTLGSLVTWRALRHDALRSPTLSSSTSERVRVARLLAEAGDWGTSSLLLARWGTQESSPGYLAAMYPPAFRKELLESATRSHVPPELLYAVMRDESRFSTRAVSPTGARGLFQFQPRTFDRLVTQWGLLDSVDLDREGYLADAESSVGLGGQWFKEILGRNDANAVLAVMEHNAGPRAIKRWFGSVRDAVETCNADVEVCVESARYPETRRFARSVVVSLAIADAVDMFGEESSQ